jgi:hypothetical protein
LAATATMTIKAISAIRPSAIRVFIVILPDPVMYLN